MPIFHFPPLLHVVQAPALSVLLFDFLCLAGWEAAQKASIAQSPAEQEASRKICACEKWLGPLGFHGQLSRFLSSAFSWGFHLPLRETLTLMLNFTNDHSHPHACLPLPHPVMCSQFLSGLYWAVFHHLSACII